jgi:hypothetical protein
LIVGWRLFLGDQRHAELEHEQGANHAKCFPKSHADFRIHHFHHLYPRSHWLDARHGKQVVFIWPGVITLRIGG